jgi:hypothetical protein
VAKCALEVAKAAEAAKEAVLDFLNKFRIFWQNLFFLLFLLFC